VSASHDAIHFDKEVDAGSRIIMDSETDNDRDAINNQDGGGTKSIEHGLESGRETAGEPDAASAQVALADRLHKHEGFHSAFLDRDRDVTVYLPPGYEDGDARRYPVLYLHDGQNLFDGTTAFIYGQYWHVGETADALIGARVVEPLIIVGINNTGERRIDEYTPTRDSRRKLGGRADLYGRFLVEELKPFVDSRYRTLADAQNTGLGGSSLGGLVSLHLGIKHPHVFGKLAVLSPSIWWDRKVILGRVRTLDTKPSLRVWIDVGTAEGDYAVKDAAALRDALITRGWKLDADLKYLEAEGAQHNELAWAERVGPVLRFLFPYEASR
jgi:predicted alpha/beta superfamily hydrolase